MNVTETSVEVNLQELLDHTSLRLCKYLKGVIQNNTKDKNYNLELISKWNCSGSQLSQFKLTFQNTSNCDANIF